MQRLRRGGILQAGQVGHETRNGVVRTLVRYALLCPGPATAPHLIAGLIAGMIVSAPVAALAQAPKAPDAELKKVEKQLEESREKERQLQEKSEALQKELDSLRDDIVKAARSSQDYEEQLSELETKVADLRRREKNLKDQLSAQDQSMLQVLTGLERLAIRPPETVLVQPGDPDDALRSAILLRSAIPALQDRAATLRQELQKLAQVRQEITSRRKEIGETSTRLDRQNDKLSKLFERKAALVKSTDKERQAAAERAQALAKDASSLRDLMVRLEVERKQREEEERNRLEAERQAKEAEAKRLAALGKPKAPDKPVPAERAEEVSGAGLPARGAVTTRYGDAVEGGTSKGVVIRTRSSAQVVAPVSGTVAFSGPFRGYGLLLIIEHRGGYHTLLSGMGRIDVSVGQRLKAGEPVGLMGSSEDPALYVEVRQDGQAVNPLPWLTARKG